MLNKILLIEAGNIRLCGVSVLLINLLKNMDRTDMEFWLYANGKVDSQDIYNHFTELGIKVVTGDQEKLNELKTYSDIKALCKKEQFDVVHVNTGNIRISGIALMAAKHGCKALRIAHSLNSGGVDNKYSFKARTFQKVNSRLADVHIACSKLAAEHLFGNDKDIVMLKNGINTAEFVFNEETRIRMRKSLGIEDCFVLGHVGRMAPAKNQEYLLEIFAEVVKADSGARLLFIGDGELRESLEQKAETLKIKDKVLFLGSIDGDAEYLQAMDVFVMPSKFEGLPLVTIEAQAAGLCVIASEAVSTECDVTGNVKILSINENPSHWAQLILESKNQARPNTRDMIVNSGYDISSSSEVMKDIYMRRSHFKNL